MLKELESLEVVIEGLFSTCQRESTVANDRGGASVLTVKDEVIVIGYVRDSLALQQLECVDKGLLVGRPVKDHRVVSCQCVAAEAFEGDDVGHGALADEVLCRVVAAVSTRWVEERLLETVGVGDKKYFSPHGERRWPACGDRAQMRGRAQVDR